MATRPTKTSTENVKTDSVEAQASSILDKVKASVASGLNSQDADEAQNHVRAVNSISKSISQLQQDIGEERDKLRKHIATLRRSSPKGKPSEGDVREIQGKPYTFVGGKFYPVENKD